MLDNAKLDNIRFLIRETEKAYDAYRIDAFTYLIEANLQSEDFARLIPEDLIEKCYHRARENKSFGDATRIFFAASKVNKLSASMQESIDVEIVRKREDDEVPAIKILFDGDAKRALITWGGDRALPPGDLRVYWGFHANEERRDVALPLVREAFQNEAENEANPEWKREQARVALQRLSQE